MFDWFASSAAPAELIAPSQIAARLFIALLYGCCVAGIYRISHGRRKADASILVTTLVLLSLLIAMVSLVIGESVARAFSLVGALSIVRFRTVVEDTRDTAFVIFAVIVGMAAGAGLWWVPVLGIPAAGAVAVVLNGFERPARLGVPGPGSLKIRLGLGRDPEAVLGAALQRHAVSWQLVGAETARQGSALDLQYRLQLRPASDWAMLVADVNQVEGVQAVEARG